MKKFLKILLGFVIGFSIISQSFASYEAVGVGIYKNYSYFANDYTLLVSGTAINSGTTLFIMYGGNYTELNSTFCDTYYNFMQDGGEGRITCVVHNIDFFSPNSLSNIYFYTASTSGLQGTFTNVMSDSQKTQTNDVLGIAVQTVLTLIYTAIMAIFLFFTQPAVIGVVATLGLIFVAYKIIRKKIMMKAGA